MKPNPTLLLMFALGCGTAAAPAPAPREPGARPSRADHPQPPGAAALPGPCVDPAADAGSRGIGGASSAPDVAAAGGPEITVTATPDLDGDGAPDRIVSVVVGLDQGAILAYVMRGACGHFVGTLEVRPDAVSATAARHHGLADLHLVEGVACEGARCGCDSGESWVRFDGTSYQTDPTTVRPSRAHDCSDASP